MIIQKEITLRGYNKGFHLITHLIVENIQPLPEKGLLNIFVKHTSAGIAINENADPSVRYDLKQFIDKLIPENDFAYTHTLEGRDDMPAHIKSTIIGSSINIPISNHHLNLGTWQGIYFCEYRNNGGPRNLVLTILS